MARISAPNVLKRLSLRVEEGAWGCFLNGVAFQESIFVWQELGEVWES